MRCLTFADAFAARGAECQFICRAHEGNLIDFIRSKGYVTHALPTAADAINNDQSRHSELAHSHWLGATQPEDAKACAVVLADQKPDWLIVDHYALDSIWEAALAPYYHQLMVIDDLADREHVCDLLLDQTFGREAADYLPLVPETCRLLCGSNYALLRPEFAALRSYSLQRRVNPVMRELLVTMGGVDKDNATGQILQALRTCSLPKDCSITVVMGATALWSDEVQNLAQAMPWPTKVLVGVSNMAQLMANSDLAIGAAGATSWERCCLGLPTIMFVLADKQLKVARGLEAANAARVINCVQQTFMQLGEFLEPLLTEPESLFHMSKCAADVTNGEGIDNLMRQMEGLC